MWRAGDPLLLDTSVIIAGFKHSESVRGVLREAGILYVPVVAYGELYFGAEKSANPAARLGQLAEFLKAVTLLDMDWRTAQHYATLRRQLERKGRPIPENDLWIAASALQHDVYLYTGDCHFGLIDDFKVLRLPI